MGKVTDPEKFNEIAITNINGFPIRVRDIGYVSDTGEEPASAASVNGRPSVVVAVTKQSGTNTVAIVDAVKERMAEITPTLPQELEVRLVRDQSEFINASLHSIQEHLILGSIFAAIIVFLFLGSFRSTIIAALAIPTSIIAAVALMALLGYTLNQMPMLSLTLMGTYWRRHYRFGKHLQVLSKRRDVAFSAAIGNKGRWPGGLPQRCLCSRCSFGLHSVLWRLPSFD